MSGTLGDYASAVNSGNILGGIAHPAQVNVLGAYNDAATAAGNIYKVRDAQAQQAWGQALQQSTDADGNVDYKKAQGLAAQNPLAAMGMQKALLDTSVLQSQGQTRGINANANVNSAIVAALAAPDDQIHDVAAAQMQRLIDLGVMPRDQGMTTLAKMPNDPGQLRAFLERTRIQMMPSDQQQAQLYGTRGTQTGPTGATTGTVQEPAGGLTAGGVKPTGAISAPPQQGVVQGLTPAQLAEQVEGPPDANGNPTKEPLIDRLRRQGIVVPGMPEYRAPAAAGLPASLRNPANAPAVTPPSSAAPAATPPPGPPAALAPGRPAVVGQSPAQVSAQGATGTASAGAFSDISNQAVAARSRGAVLDNMLSDTTQFTSGPLTNQIAAVRALANRFGIPVNTEGLSAKESFQKLAAQLNQNQGSDARLAISEASNPHADLSPAGLDLMIRQLRGNEDYLQARGQLAAGYGNKADSQGFENQVGSKLDPRAFQFARMTGDLRRKYVATLSTGDKTKLQTAYNFAHDNGLVGD